MARQPINSRLPNTGIALGPGFLAERPKAAALIAECIATWSEIELQTGRLIASVLGVPFEPVTAFYLTLANQRDKRKVLDPISEYIFTEKTHIDLYKALMRAKSSSENDRIEFAHCLFGIASDDPEGVISISTTDRIRNMFEIDEILQERHKWLGVSLGYSSETPMRNEDWNKTLSLTHHKILQFIYHYTIDDITSILEDMKTLHRLMPVFNGFANAVRRKHDELTQERYRQLCLEPLVRRFLSPTPSSPESVSSK
jgi:hypothetical protein